MDWRRGYALRVRVMRKVKGAAAGQSDEEGEGQQKLLQNNPMWF